MAQPLKLGLFGFGTVGQGLYGVLNETRGLNAEIVRICVKDRQKQRPIAREHFTFEPSELLEDPELDVIVELIDTADEAFAIVQRALANGKAVVTANKKMVAEHLGELVELQQQYGVPLLYEAACAGSIPIVRNLEEYYDNDLLSSLSGVLNGTCNYILTRMYEESVDYAPVLADAQAKGFAESDPTLDVDGLDAKYKLVILTGHAFGTIPAPADVLTLGIRQASAHDFQFAREKGYKLQLEALSRRLPGERLASYVLPRFVRPSDLIHNVSQEFNGVVVEAAFAEQQFFMGKGAGSYPTASAVLSDISALSFSYKYSYKKRAQNAPLALDRDVTLRVYLRYPTGHEPVLEQLGVHNIEVRHSAEGVSYVIGRLQLGTLLSRHEELRHEPFFLALMPEQPELDQGEPAEAAAAEAVAARS
jgi:homoserine dehydrogenase